MDKFLEIFTDWRSIKNNSWYIPTLKNWTIQFLVINVVSILGEGTSQSEIVLFVCLIVSISGEGTSQSKIVLFVCLFVCIGQLRHNLSPMPPKRKESAPTPQAVASGPKPKRSKTSFRTPTPAAFEGSSSATTEVGSTKNRIVTLRASASGRRGYRTQDLSTSQSTSLHSLAAEDSGLPSDDTTNIADISDPNPPMDLDGDFQPGSGAKSKPKKKNTTTVSFIGYKMHFSNKNLD
jgi:hypothetical protein